MAAAGLLDFSEAEQLAAYAARYGTVLSQDKRRIRLLHRQLFAVHALEVQAASPVGLQDGCEAWLIDSLAKRLARGGVTTLADLHARITARPDWWRDLRGIGVAKARALERFVAAHAETLGPLPQWEALPVEDPCGRRLPWRCPKSPHSCRWSDCGCRTT
ncbi:hypothetical protein AU476_18230 [Cupriavidus sp. UYMSc13B]|nr:hypothetical protein AU476_18230 [Cupriavidus sp. UYMSc13B]